MYYLCYYISEVEGITFKLGALLRTLSSFWVPINYVNYMLDNYQDQLTSTFFLWSRNKKEKHHKAFVSAHFADL